MYQLLFIVLNNLLLINKKSKIQLFTQTTGAETLCILITQVHTYFYCTYKYTHTQTSSAHSSTHIYFFCTSHTDLYTHIPLHMQVHTYTSTAYTSTHTHFYSTYKYTHTLPLHIYRYTHNFFILLLHISIQVHMSTSAQD